MLWFNSMNYIENFKCKSFLNNCLWLSKVYLMVNGVVSNYDEVKMLPVEIIWKIESCVIGINMQKNISVVKLFI